VKYNSNALLFFSNIDKLPTLDDKPTHYSLSRISRRVPPKGIHQLFSSIGFDQPVIDEKQMLFDKSITQFILSLLLEWAMNPNATYQLLVEALQEHHQYSLEIEEVR